MRTYPGEEYVPQERRATYEPGYGRRGKLWVRGAFEPATAEAVLTFSGRRDSVSHIALLERVVTAFPCVRRLLIEDNLSTHHNRDTQAALLAWPDVRLLFLPTSTAWLNLIEPWGRLLKALALKVRRFEGVAELEGAFRAALAYWLAHWHSFTRRKRPQTQPSPVLVKYGRASQSAPDRLGERTTKYSSRRITGCVGPGRRGLCTPFALTGSARAARRAGPRQSHRQGRSAADPRPDRAARGRTRDVRPGDHRGRPDARGDRPAVARAL